MKATLTRDFYIPQGAKPHTIKDLPAVVYTYETNGVPCAVAFSGKRNKPDWHYRFRTDEARTDKVKKFLSDAAMTFMSRKVYREKRKAERSQPHTLKVDDILYSDWGYDQTNINFYQVTKVIGKNTVEIREIASNTVDNSSPSANYVIANPGAFLTPRWEHDRTGRPMVRRVDGSSNSVKVSECQTAFPWDGKPRYETALGWGH